MKKYLGNTGFVQFNLNTKCYEAGCDLINEGGREVWFTSDISWDDLIDKVREDHAKELR